MHWFCEFYWWVWLTAEAEKYFIIIYDICLTTLSAGRNLTLSDDVSCARHLSLSGAVFMGHEFSRAVVVVLWLVSYGALTFFNSLL
jgi:hypothetical protein